MRSARERYRILSLTMNVNQMTLDREAWAKAVDEAEDLIKDVVRHQPVLPFHKDDILHIYHSGRFKEILGLSDAPAGAVKQAFEEAGTRAKIACPGLEASPHTIVDSDDLRYIWRISTRAEFFRCFPQFGSDGTVHASPIANLVATLRDNEFFGIGWDWSDKACEWSVTPSKSALRSSSSEGRTN